MDEATLREVIALVEARGARLLLDETYREMTFGDALPVAASLSPSVISVSSLSKTYGLPGIRIGWLVTRDRDLRDRFLAAKEQILISGSLVDETIALHALRRRPAWLPDIRARIDEAFRMTDGWLRRPRAARVGPAARRGRGLPAHPPGRAGVDPDAFYRVLFEEHGTIVGPGHWFEQPRSYFRLGYGWPTLDRAARGAGRDRRGARRDRDGLNARRARTAYNPRTKV